MSPVRVGVVGTGWWATAHHIPAILAHPDAQLAGLVDSDSNRLALCVERFGQLPTFRDHRDLLRANLLDAVVVATPHASHYKIARDTLLAGVHVLVEKPMALRAVDAWDLVELVQESRRQLVVGVTHQFTPYAAKAREMVRTGRLGGLRLVAVTMATAAESLYRARPEDYRARFAPPVVLPVPATYSVLNSGGGQGYTQAIHPISMVFHVTGDRARSVSALMGTFDLEVDLADAIAFAFESGAIGSLATTGSVRPGQPETVEIRYYGSEGMLLQDLAGGRLEAHFNDGSSELLPPLSAAESYPTAAPVNRLIDLVKGGSDNPADATTGAITVSFLEAAYSSAANSGRPVDVEQLVPRTAAP